MDYCHAYTLTYTGHLAPGYAAHVPGQQVGLHNLARRYAKRYGLQRDPVSLSLFTQCCQSTPFPFMSTLPRSLWSVRAVGTKEMIDKLLAKIKRCHELMNII